MNNHFIIYSHLNLQELFNRAKNFKAGKLYRWAVRLQDFSFTCRYLPGSKNIFADYLSRDTIPEDGIHLFSDKEGKPSLNVIQLNKPSKIDVERKVTHNPDIVKVISDEQLKKYLKQEVNYLVEDTIDYYLDKNTKCELDILYPLNKPEIDIITHHNYLEIIVKTILTTIRN